MLRELGRGGEAGAGVGIRWTAGLLALSVAALGCNGSPTEPPDETPPPAVSLNLAPGELQVIDDADQVRAFALQGVTGGQEYIVAVQSAAGSGTAQTPMRLRVTAGSGGSALRPAPSSQARAELTLEERAAIGHLTLMENMRRELQRAGAVPARPGDTPLRGRTDGSIPPSFSVSAQQGPPQVGDTLEFFIAVQDDLNADCSDTTRVIAGVVRDVGDGFALVEDTAAAGHFSEADYQELNQELDDIVFPTNTAYWGTPADLDGNERVIVLFTPEVNKLSDPEGQTFIAGFFWPGDLATQQSCPASNFGELLYLLAPDPDGDFGIDVDVEFAKRNARGVTAHEFQHLLTAQQRVTKGGGSLVGESDLEETWLSEGYAHIAEEVAGLASRGQGLRQNLGLNQVTNTQAAVDAFNAYHLQNFRRMGHFFLNPAATPGLAVGDPGDLESLRMRGFAWSFLRWLADHYVPAGGGGALPGAPEDQLFLELSRGQPGSAQGRGTANIVRALSQTTGTSRTWQHLLGEYSSMPPLTDTGQGIPDEARVLTWNVRNMFNGLHNSNIGQSQQCTPFCDPYPLELTEMLVDGGQSSVNFDLRPSAQRYFVVRSQGLSADVVLEVSTQTGGNVPATARPQVTVVRVQ